LGDTIFSWDGAAGRNAMSWHNDTSPRTSAAGPQTSGPMHAKDRRFWVVLTIWAGIAVGAISTGIGAFIANSPHWGFGLCAIGLVGAAVATLHLLETKPSFPRSSRVNILMILVAGLTWVFIAWQTWLWFHSPPRYTQAQLDEAVAQATKPLKDQLDQSIKDAESLRQQIADAVAKVQPQSDAPVSVERTPTRLRILFKPNDIEEIETRNVLWFKLLAATSQTYSRPLLGQGTNTFITWAIVMVFKKPIIYKEIHIDDHGSGLLLPPPDIETNSRYAVIRLNSFAPTNGLADFIPK
jgi:hypothetical protein